MVVLNFDRYQRHAALPSGIDQRFKRRLPPEGVS
jgi:hypothetical protein